MKSSCNTDGSREGNGGKIKQNHNRQKLSNVHRVIMTSSKTTELSTGFFKLGSFSSDYECQIFISISLSIALSITDYLTSVTQALLKQFLLMHNKPCNFVRAKVFVSYIRICSQVILVTKHAHG